MQTAAAWSYKALGKLGPHQWCKVEAAVAEARQEQAEEEAEAAAAAAIGAQAPKRRARRKKLKPVQFAEVSPAGEAPTTTIVEPTMPPQPEQVHVAPKHRPIAPHEERHRMTPTGGRDDDVTRLPGGEPYRPFWWTSEETSLPIRHQRAVEQELASVPSVPHPPFVYGPMEPGGGPPIAPMIEPGVFRFGETP